MFPRQIDGCIHIGQQFLHPILNPSGERLIVCNLFDCVFISFNILILDVFSLGCYGWMVWIVFCNYIIITDKPRIVECINFNIAIPTIYTVYTIFTIRTDFLSCTSVVVFTIAFAFTAVVVVLASFTMFSYFELLLPL